MIEPVVQFVEVLFGLGDQAVEPGDRSPFNLTVAQLGELGILAVDDRLVLRLITVRRTFLTERASVSPRCFRRDGGCRGALRNQPLQSGVPAKAKELKKTWHNNTGERLEIGGARTWQFLPLVRHRLRCFFHANVYGQSIAGGRYPEPSSISAKVP